ncbi:hypothetical protein [Pikeienuella sp. HZG-20]|uniref:hypothetical protein n=1 Tax=Paludibacillus litoralis TaxID=3133267 RepID=UPI0030EBD691
MPTDIMRLLPNSFPSSNAHRHVVYTADTQPDELARAPILTADAIAAARAAVRIYEADPIADEALDPAFRALAELVRTRQVLDDDFIELADEMLQRLARIGSEASSGQVERIQRHLTDALTLSRRVLDLLIAERDIGRIREIRPGR